MKCIRIKVDPSLPEIHKMASPKRYGWNIWISWDPSSGEENEHSVGHPEYISNLYHTWYSYTRKKLQFLVYILIHTMLPTVVYNVWSLGHKNLRLVKNSCDIA